MDTVSLGVTTSNLTMVCAVAPIVLVSACFGVWVSSLLLVCELPSTLSIKSLL